MVFATLPHNAQYPLERPAGADDTVEIVDVRLGVPQVVNLVPEPAHLERLVDLELHLLDFEGLLHVVERADLHRFDCGLHRPECGHQDDGRRRLQCLRRAQHFHAVAAAHLEIAHDHIELPPVQLFDRGVPAVSFYDLVPSVGQGPSDAAA